MSAFSFSHFSSCYLLLLVVVALFHLCLSKQNFDDVLCIKEERQALLDFKHPSLMKHVHFSNMGWLLNLRLLRHLDMSTVDLSKGTDSFQVINNLPSLAELHLKNSYLLDAHPHVPTLNTTSLLLLDLSGNEFSHSIVPEWIFSITSLVSLDLSKCGFNGLIPSNGTHSFRNLTSSLELKELSSDIGRNLISLDVSWCHISSTALDSLHNLTSLLSLYLLGYQLTNMIPKSLGKRMRKIKSLNMRANKLDGKLPGSHEVCYLTHIQILDLSYNKLVGDIPKCFNNFSVLSGKESISDDQFSVPAVSKTVFFSLPLVMKGHEYMYNSILKLMRLFDLSDNKLIGHIPSELTTLIKFKSLNLSRNQLTRRIPEKIGDLTELESFDLSLNKLSGELPMSLSSLNSLSSYNVSYNNLTGKISSSTQLQSLNRLCFAGNTLCGDPLTERCPRVEAPDTDNKEDGGSDGENWGLIVSVLSGFIVGFWVILAPLIVSR